MKRHKLVAALCLTIASSGAYGATSQIIFNNTITPVVDALNIPLTAGGDAVGDGAIIQIGYFTTSTASFEGEWVPITGAGSLNGGLLTSVGDGGDASSDGIFAGNVVFNDSSSSTSSGLPAGGTQLAIRFYNGTSIATSTHFNTVTSSSWNFIALATPAPLPESMDLDADTIVWQDAANPFQTGILIPEPSTALLGAVGALGLLRRRRN